MIPSTTQSNPKRKQRRCRTAAVLALTVAGAMALGPVRRVAACWYDPIIFDPTALAEHVQQVVQLGQQIGAAVEQVKNQVLELTHLASDIAPNESAIVAVVQGQLDASLYDTASRGNQLDTRYPFDMGNATWAQYLSDESTWTSNERQALVENRQLENQVYRDMETTRRQVQQIVEASNSAPGETAAIQAHNDLLAVASGEFAKLQALKAARSRLKTEGLARQQSELSYAAAEQSRVSAGWDDPAPASGSVADPFQN